MSEAITRLNAALWGRYRIERELGEGGMATVYLADDLRHERKVALRVLKPELAAVVGAGRPLIADFGGHRARVTLMGPTEVALSGSRRGLLRPPRLPFRHPG